MAKNNYLGWELQSFDNANNFRNYQFSLFKKYIRGEVAEVGPGNGSLVKLYNNKVKKIYLFEPSKNLFINLKKKLKKNKKIYFFNKKLKFKTNSYNTILYLDVLEHIKNDKLEITKAYKALKTGGHLIINVPAFQHLYSQFDKDINHYRRYNKSKIREITKNFNIIEIKYFDTVGYMLSLLSKIFITDYKKNFKKKIMLWNSLIFFSKILDYLLFNLFGKSLLIVIRKD